MDIPGSRRGHGVLSAPRTYEPRIRPFVVYRGMGERSIRNFFSTTDCEVLIFRLSLTRTSRKMKSKQVASEKLTEMLGYRFVRTNSGNIEMS